jgi:hypothetical protein
MLETTATLARGMKPWDKASSFRDANTLFQGQQNKDRERETREERTQRRRETQRRETTEEQITEER